MLKRVAMAAAQARDAGCTVSVKVNTFLCEMIGAWYTCEKAKGYTAMVSDPHGRMKKANGATVEDALARALGVEPRKRAKKEASC